MERAVHKRKRGGEKRWEDRVHLRTVAGEGRQREVCATDHTPDVSKRCQRGMGSERGGKRRKEGEIELLDIS